MKAKDGERMRDFRSAAARGVTPYVCGEQPTDRAYIKLNANENAYSPSPRVAEAVAAEVSRLQYYPDMTSAALRGAIAAAHGVRPEQVYVGNGSDEVLAFTFLAFFAGERLSAPDLTYSFYPCYAKLFGVDYREVPLRADFTVDVDGLEASGGGVIFANPNAPTSLELGQDAVRALALRLSGQDRLLVVDEAYAAFGEGTAIPLTQELDNVLVVRTLSKAHALAGLRVGYAIGSEALIAALQGVKDSVNSYPVDRIAAAAAQAAVEDEAYLRRTVSMICRTRDETARRLRALGMTVLPSRTNFLFATHPLVQARTLLAALRADGILVRHFQRPRLENFLRITVGTDEQMDCVVQSMARALEAR